MSENRAPSTVWVLGRDFSRGHVRTNADDLIAVTVTDPFYDELRTVRMSRRDARMVARRINECLDATAKR